MLDLKTQSQLLEVGAAVMRWHVLAANMAAASVARSFALWAALLEATSAATAPQPAAPATPGTAWRSAGGHAVAQVAIAPAR